MTRLCICGGGSLGLVTAGVLAQQDGVEVNLLTSKPSEWSKEIKVSDLNGKLYQGHLHIISDQAEQVIPQSDIILLCVPGFLIEKTLRDIASYITTQAVGSIVSSTGFFFRAHEIFDNKTALFGFQRVPYIARVAEYGHTAQLLGYKTQLYMAIENLPDSFATQWGTWLNTPVAALHNYLEAALTNSNPLLHPSRLYGMWHDWTPAISYPTQTKFYADWDELSAETYIACDNEFQTLTRVLGIHIPSVLEYYESHDAASLMNKLRSIEAFKMILAPMKQTESGWVPDFESRYFTEDFPFGLQLVKDLALQHDIVTPTIDRVLTWGKQLIGDYERK
ncbi:MAG: NAD/NADP octopine/nopaline dehydrogenase family protein [Paludibacteraceae bacterium]|nr:NAD/NADP octopine/nopaline dehydrogenase family protein [Paludibacteraceae bacterium]